MADEPPSDCVECGTPINDPEWSRNSGGLCPDCLAGHAIPLFRVGLPPDDPGNPDP